MKKQALSIFLVIIGLFIAGCVQREASNESTLPLRIEAEQVESSIPAYPSFEPQSEDEKKVLSNGDWLTVAGEEPFSIAYIFSLSNDEPTELWVRGFRSDWQYCIGDGEWITPSGPLHSRQTVVREGTRYLTIHWQNLGELPAKKGESTLHIRRDPQAENSYFAIDCFEIRPSGGPPPRGGWTGEAVPSKDVPAEWMAFDPGFLGNQPVQLGPENLKPAGQLGPLVRDGSTLRFENSDQPVRFWGVTASTRNLFQLSRADMQRLARLLSSRGVNLVRIHGAPYLEETPGPLTDGIQRFVAALKEEGIYIGIDWVCTAVDSVSADWNLPGFSGGERIQSLFYFSEPFRENVRARGRNLLLSPNPYTGIPLAHDPAVAFVMLIDEDGPFFWTFSPDRMPPALKVSIEQQWAEWVIARYGDLPTALTTWGATPFEHLKGTDAPEEKRMALYAAGHLGGADWMVTQRNAARAIDQVEFMTHTARNAYRDMTAWLRDEIGYPGVVLGSNWKTADERVLGPLEYELYTATDATARNTYFSSKFTKKKFHPWMVGDTFLSRSLLLEPNDALATHPQLEAFPHLMTEGGYEMPNRYRTEGPLLVAAYYALQGVDAYLPFQLEADWNLEMKKWPYLTPVTFGQSPAAAFIYRSGYVKEAPVVYRDTTPLSDLMKLQGGTLDVSAGLDAIQGQYAPDSAHELTTATEAFNPLAFYVGRVVRNPGEKPLQGPVASKYIHAENKTVDSITGELQLNWDQGVLKIDAPCAQAAVGFFDRVETTDALFIQDGPYGAMALVSLDGNPLQEARAMLLQVMTEEKALGFETEPCEEGERITANGRAPMILRKPAGSVQFKFADAEQLSITALDHAGHPVEPAALNDHATLTLLPNTIYYRLEREVSNEAQ